MITEDYVSFEVAKLLREKGFNENTSVNYFVGDDKLRGCAVGEMIYHKRLEEDTHLIPAPTLQMAMKWLRLVHGLHVEPIPDCFDYKHGDIHDGWFCEITHLSDMSYDADYDSHKKHKTCEEACEDAIKFCLENLI